MGIRLKDLSKLGYRDNVARSLVVDIVSKHCKYDTKEQIEMTLSDILEHPEFYKNNEIWNKLAKRLSPTIIAKEFIAYDLLDEPLMYKTYGGKFIETLAKQQMNLAMRLPVTVAGALMPDAHAGYGLPIGGVHLPRGGSERTKVWPVSHLFRRTNQSADDGRGVGQRI